MNDRAVDHAFVATDWRLALSLTGFGRSTAPGSKNTMSQVRRPRIKAAVWIGTMLVSLFPSVPARADIVYVRPSEALGTIVGIGLGDVANAARQYGQNSAQVVARLNAVGQELEKCGQCSERLTIEAEWNRLRAYRQQTLDGEQAALRAMGIPFNNFADAVAIRNYQLPRTAEGRAVDTHKANTVVNFCYSTNPKDIEGQRACIQMFHDDIVDTRSTRGPRVCWDRVTSATKVDMAHFPPPTAVKAVREAHANAWEKYRECTDREEIWLQMRLETNKACKVDDIGAALSRLDFVCACKGIEPPEGTMCPANLQVTTASVPRVGQLNPAIRMVAPGGYGPALLGIRIGMPLAEAESLVRRHMTVGRTATTGVPNDLNVEGRLKEIREQGLKALSGGLSGKLFVSQDLNEYVALFEAPDTFPGRVFMVGQGKWVPLGQPEKLQAEMSGRLGRPATFSDQPGAYWSDREGKIRPDLVCPGLPGRLDRSNWVEAGGQSIGSERNRDDRLGMISHLQMPRRVGSFWHDNYECGPVIRSSIDGNPGDGRMAFVLSLYDAPLISYYNQEQKGGYFH